MATSNGSFNFGGILTEEIVYGDSPESKKLRELLLQDPTQNDESLINLVKAHGYDGAVETDSEMKDKLRELINGSANKTDNRNSFTDKTMIQRAKSKNPLLRRQTSRV